MHNLSGAKLVGFQDNKRASKTNFHMEGCVPGLVLNRGKRHLGIKWPIKWLTFQTCYIYLVKSISTFKIYCPRFLTHITQQTVEVVNCQW